MYDEFNRKMVSILVVLVVATIIFVVFKGSLSMLENLLMGKVDIILNQSLGF